LRNDELGTAQSLTVESELDEMANSLEATGDYRILRRLRPRDVFESNAGLSQNIGIILDLETTGLNTELVEVIEIGLLKFAYSDDGVVSHVIDKFSSLCEPRGPIPAEVTALTGITPEHVAGHRIDSEAVAAFIGDADVIIAHNAKFDRRIGERYWQALVSKAWACSATQVEWRKHGFESARLDHLLRGVGLFHKGHRALSDCYALLEVLSRPLIGVNRPAMALLVEKHAQTIARVWAEGASYSVKDELKARGYKWNNGNDGRPKSWYRDVSDDASTDETEYLRQDIYRKDVKIRVQKIDALSRFSIRD
jgi:DNA polymerase-3 subunit epsilon